MPSLKEYIKISASTIVAWSLLWIPSACKNASTVEAVKTVTVSLPVEAYFIERIAGDNVKINVMIPQSAGHSDYTPKPSQMMSLSKSERYLAIGSLDFETTWHDRITSVNPEMKWVDLSSNINLIRDEEEEHEEAHSHAIDPHYWLAPKEALVMAENIAKELKEIENTNVEYIDSAYSKLKGEIEEYDKRLKEATEGRKMSFMIYHPALTYMARDYDMQQMEIEKDGNAPTPQTYMEQIEKAKSNGVKVVFVQEGYDLEKADKAAEMLNAQVVKFIPEGYDWKTTMDTIIKALGE